MHLGLCTSASANAGLIAGSTLDYVEENVQGFLLPRDPDAAAWTRRLADAKACGKPIRAWATTAFARAKQAGITAIVFGSGGSRRIPDGFDRAQARAQFVDLLKELGPLAAAQNVTLVVEPLNTGECNFITSVDEGAAIVRDAATPGVRLLADIYHMLRDAEGPAAITRAGSLLAHVHIAEREKRTAPGVAGDDFAPYLRALAGIGYDGNLSIESGWQDLAAQLPAALAELRRQLGLARQAAVAG